MSDPPSSSPALPVPPAQPGVSLPPSRSEDAPTSYFFERHLQRRRLAKERQPGDPLAYSSNDFVPSSPTQLITELWASGKDVSIYTGVPQLGALPPRPVVAPLPLKRPAHPDAAQQQPELRPIETPNGATSRKAQDESIKSSRPQEDDQLPPRHSHSLSARAAALLARASQPSTASSSSSSAKRPASSNQRPPANARISAARPTVRRAQPSPLVTNDHSLARAPSPVSDQTPPAITNDKPAKRDLRQEILQALGDEGRGALSCLEREAEQNQSGGISDELLLRLGNAVEASFLSYAANEELVGAMWHLISNSGRSTAEALKARFERLAQQHAQQELAVKDAAAAAAADEAAQAAQMRARKRKQLAEAARAHPSDPDKEDEASEDEEEGDEQGRTTNSRKKRKITSDGKKKLSEKPHKLPLFPPPSPTSAEPPTRRMTGGLEAQFILSDSPLLDSEPLDKQRAVLDSLLRNQKSRGNFNFKLGSCSPNDLLPLAHALPQELFTQPDDGVSFEPIGSPLNSRLAGKIVSLPDYYYLIEVYFEDVDEANAWLDWRRSPAMKTKAEEQGLWPLVELQLMGLERMWGARKAGSKWIRAGVYAGLSGGYEVSPTTTRVVVRTFQHFVGLKAQARLTLEAFALQSIAEWQQQPDHHAQVFVTFLATASDLPPEVAQDEDLHSLIEAMASEARRTTVWDGGSNLIGCSRINFPSDLIQMFKQLPPFMPLEALKTNFVLSSCLYTSVARAYYPTTSIRSVIRGLRSRQDREIAPRTEDDLEQTKIAELAEDDEEETPDLEKLNDDEEATAGALEDHMEEEGEAEAKEDGEGDGAADEGAEWVEGEGQDEGHEDGSQEAEGEEENSSPHLVGQRFLLPSLDPAQRSQLLRRYPINTEIIPPEKVRELRPKSKRVGILPYLSAPFFPALFELVSSLMLKMRGHIRYFTVCDAVNLRVGVKVQRLWKPSNPSASTMRLILCDGIEAFEIMYTFSTLYRGNDLTVVWDEDKGRLEAFGTSGRPIYIAEGKGSAIDWVPFSWTRAKALSSLKGTCTWPKLDKESRADARKEDTETGQRLLKKLL